MVKFGPLPDMRRQLCLHSVLWVTWLNIIQAAPAPQAEPTTIVAFGDSTTAERGATKVYAKILQEELQNVRVVNAGVGGNTTEIARRRFEADVLGNQPKIAIVQFGINDAAVDVWKTPPATAPRVSLKRYEENLRFFVQTLKFHRTRVVMMTPTPICWTPKLREMYGKPPYQPDQADGLNALMTPYCEAVRRIAREESVELVDMQLALAKEAAKLGLTVDVLLSDGMHPNDRGHRIEADLLLERINALKSTQGNPAAHN
jgi:lysophospholipase L1-like esterase